MAKKKTTYEPSPEEKLYDVRKQMSALREVEKKLAFQVLNTMLETKQRRGDRFMVAVKQTLRVAEPELAFKWAAERNCISVDTTKAMRILRREFTIPDFFEVHKTNYLRLAGRPEEINDGDDS